MSPTSYETPCIYYIYYIISKLVFSLIKMHVGFLLWIAEALGTGSSSWQSEDGGPNSRRGGETPSSCATPTSASFPSEPEVDADVGVNADGTNATAPYPCQFCDRTFPRLSYLKKHEQVSMTIILSLFSFFFISEFFTSTAAYSHMR